MKLKDERKTMINNSDLNLLIFATFRYSLGRRTYMPGFIVDLIIKNSEIINKRHWKQFIEEIKNIENLGDSCDVQTWNELIYFCENKLKEITN